MGFLYIKNVLSGLNILVENYYWFQINDKSLINYYVILQTFYSTGFSCTIIHSFDMQSKDLLEHPLSSQFKLRIPSTEEWSLWPVWCSLANSKKKMLAMAVITICGALAVVLLKFNVFGPSISF